MIREDSHVNFLEAAEWIHWTTVSLWSLEEVFSSGIQPLIRILSGPASTTATSRRIAHLAIGPLGVLLLHVGVERGIRKIGLFAVLALKISPLIVILRPPLANVPRRIMVVDVTVGVLRVVQIVLAVLLIVISILVHRILYFFSYL